MFNSDIIDELSSIKNVECPHCGYLLPILYNKDTNVNNLLITCKGRQCKKSFVLNIKHGVQQNASIPEETIEAFKIVFGDDWLNHLKDKYGDSFKLI